MSKQFNDLLEAVNLATKLLTTLGYKVHHDPTVDPVSGVWDIDTPAGRRQSACEAGALCRLASQAVDDFVTSHDTPKTYTTRGNVRGCCGHKHRTIEAAKRCADRDQSECSRQGGYSDRRVVNSDRTELSESDLNELYYLCR